MANSFPGSVKTFSAKATGDIIQVTHVTDLESEVVALETILLNGPFTMGNSTVNTVFSAGSLAITGNVGIGTTSPNGKFEVTGTNGSINLNNNGDQVGFTRNGYNYVTASGAAATLQIQASGASGQLTFATAGTERARFDSSGSFFTTGNVAFGNTSASGFGRLVSWGGASGTATSSGAFVTPGTAQSEKSDLALYSTFEGTADNGPRRTADIIAGFNGGAWGYEYLAFNVGNGGSANDTKVVTSEKMRLDANGNLGLGNTTPSTPGGTRNFYMTSAGTTIMRVHSTVANTGQARFDWTTPAGNGYVIAGLYEQSGAGPYFQISSGSGVVDGIYDLPTHVFRISGTERWRVSTGGHFLAGTDNAYDIGASGATRPRDFFLGRNAVIGGNVTSSTVYSTTVGATNRDLYVDNTGLFGYVSSIRASKTEIAPLANVEWLHALSPVSFRYRKRDENGVYTEEPDGITEFGLIAEDTEVVKPELCFYDVVDGTPELRGISYSKLIVPLLKAVQEQQAIIDKLTARIAALEADRS